MIHRRVGPLREDAAGRRYVTCACGAQLGEAGPGSGTAVERTQDLVALVVDHMHTFGLVEPPTQENT